MTDLHSLAGVALGSNSFFLHPVIDCIGETPYPGWEAVEIGATYLQTSVCKTDEQKMGIMWANLPDVIEKFIWRGFMHFGVAVTVDSQTTLAITVLSVLCTILFTGGS